MQASITGRRENISSTRISSPKILSGRELEETLWFLNLYKSDQMPLRKVLKFCTASLHQRRDRSPNRSYTIVSCRVLKSSRSGSIKPPSSPSAYLVTRWHPFAIWHQLLSPLINIWPCSRNLVLEESEKPIDQQFSRRLPSFPISHKNDSTHNSQIFKRPSPLNVLQCSIQALQLGIYLPLCFLSALDGLCLKRINRFDLLANVISHRLEFFELGFYLIDDGLVF